MHLKKPQQAFEQLEKDNFLLSIMGELNTPPFKEKGEIGEKKDPGKKPVSIPIEKQLAEGEPAKTIIELFNGKIIDFFSV